YGQFLQFMVQLNRMALNTRQEQETAQQHSELTQKVLKYIAEHLSEALSLDVLADRFYVSKYYLSHAFTREVGVSVYRYLMMRRLLLARQLLLAGEPAGQVCRSCGFSDYTSFYRAFKSEYGISPRDFAAGG
ncbi:MAG: helix-turn-helix transcriptional regulator, partial [Oscillospiraceae bacterium]|nr:helix-turn-helix transcriptional regulator [Oscillospiraceae bacterium]